MRMDAVRLFTLGEGVKDETDCHAQEANEKSKVVGLSRVRASIMGERLNDLSQNRHEESCASHGEEINHSDDSARDGNREKVFGVRKEEHSEAGEKPHKKEENSKTGDALDV